MARVDVVDLPRNEAGIAEATASLAGRFGGRFQAGQAIRAQHAHTATYLPAQAPDGVVFAETVRRQGF